MVDEEGWLQTEISKEAWKAISSGDIPLPHLPLSLPLSLPLPIPLCCLLWALLPTPLKLSPLH